MQSIKIDISVVFKVYILMMPCGDPSHLLTLISLRVYLWSVWSGCECKYHYCYRGKVVSCENVVLSKHIGTKHPAKRNLILNVICIWSCFMDIC
ncbi:hypothetical protein KSP40_PGU021405 [Platanthera guangdongensis]|uniref:Uncharacterized protein n=1 Tax=Platanthera guangdongensis TaxID=2320717 RepID=A0ABR2LT44_9ASPA